MVRLKMTWTWTWTLALVLSIVSGQGVAKENVTGQHFGAQMPEAGEVLPLHSAINQLQGDKALRQKFSGKVNSVCRKKGCWMILSDKGMHARVTFKDYGFFVPRDSANQDSVVYGVLTEKTLSKKRARHYAKDAGKAVDDINDDVKEYSIVADSVYLAGQ